MATGKKQVDVNAALMNAYIAAGYRRERFGIHSVLILPDNINNTKVMLYGETDCRHDTTCTDSSGHPVFPASRGRVQ